MIILFTGITAANLVCLLLTAAMGYWGIHHPDVKPWHQLAGAVAALICCATHCIVFTYFIATAKWAQHAVSVKKLDASLVAPTRSFKAQALPAALACIAATLLTIFVGAATVSYELRGTAHHVLAILTLIVNIVGAIFEYRAIRKNGALIDGILARINSPA